MSRFIFAALLAVISVMPAVAEVQTFTFTVIGIDCKECGPPILKGLRAIPGVKDPKLDWRKGLATVTMDSSFDKTRLRAALTNLGYEVVFPGEKAKGFQPLPGSVRKTLDIKTDSGEKRFKVKELLVPGKITILDFYADWCGPCHVLDARLQHLVAANKDIAVRRINVGKWDNAAARQATAEFRAEALPYVRIYDGSGKFIAAPRGGMWDEVLAAVDKSRSGA